MERECKKTFGSRIFYALFLKKIVCFSCGLVYRHSIFEDPFVWHAREQRLCLYLNEVLGHCDTWKLDRLVKDFHPNLHFKRDNFNISIVHKYLSTCDYTCIICQFNVANVVLLPCAHFVLCINCMFQLEHRHCPSCRQTFDSIFRVNI